MTNQAQTGTKKMLTEVEAKDLLKQAGIPVVETRLAKTKKEAQALSKDLGFPVGLKIVSKDIIHKSDVGGVKLNLANASQVAKAYDEIMASVQQKVPGASIEGVSVQKMAPPGVEIIIGMSLDAQFGPVIMFGLGGILVELLKDVSFRIVPLTRRDADEMVHEIKGYALLQGYRGQEAIDLNALENLILKVSEFVEKNPQVEELDLNPVFAYKDGVLAVDARIAISQKVPTEIGN